MSDTSSLMTEKEIHNNRGGSEASRDRSSSRGRSSSSALRNNAVNNQSENKSPRLFTALIAGGVAGTVVDAVLFPIDTMKTRLQSKQGFRAAGGFRNVYSGIGAALLGSSPNSSIFFGVYELTKKSLMSSGNEVSTQMIASTMGALGSCLARVPADNVKQKVQAGIYQNTISAIQGIRASQGIEGFFVGFQSTILREMPFSVIQFTVWEALKRRVQVRYKRSLSPWESGLCGSVAGGLAAAITTPIDVLKTRQMIGDAPRDASTFGAFRYIFKREGMKGLLSGFIPRIQLCFLGGLIFFSAYDFSLSVLEQALDSNSRLDDNWGPLSFNNSQLVREKEAEEVQPDTCSSLRAPTVPEVQRNIVLRCLQ